MKTKFTLLLAIVFLFTINVVAQVKVTPNRVTHKRTGPDVIDGKKTFEINYPRFSGLDKDVIQHLDRTFSYWRIFDTSLQEEIDFQWLYAIDYKVDYNRNGILVMTITRSGASAYPSDFSKTIVADLSSGSQIQFTDAFKDRIKLLTELDKRQTAEMTKAEKTYIAEGGEGKLFNEYTPKVSDRADEFSVNSYGVTFHFDYEFPHVSLALQPEGRFFFSWAELKPYLVSYGPINELSTKPIPETVVIADLRLGGVLGGVQDRSFVTAEEASRGMTGTKSFAYLLPGASNIGLTANQYKSVVNVSISKEQSDDICPDYRSVTTNLTERKGVAIGMNAAWNPVPRGVTSMDVNNKTYQAIVSAFLATKKIPGSKVVIKQLYKTDLDGDGTDEVVIAATNYTRSKNEYEVDKGGYSFVMARKIVNGKAIDILLGGDFITEEESFYQNYEVSAIADLNGDGKMEVVVFSEYYEGASTAAFELDGAEAVRVMETGCGL